MESMDKSQTQRGTEKVSKFVPIGTKVKLFCGFIKVTF